MVRAWPACTALRHREAIPAELHAAADLTLRPLATTDVPALYRLTAASRERLRTWLPWVEGTTSPGDTAAFVQRAIGQADAGTGLHLGLHERGVLAGVIGCRRQDPPQSLDVGYWLGEGFEGRGLMTAGCRALVTHAFAALGLHRVQIRAATGNARSRAIPERLGFRLEGVLAEAEHIASGWVDHCVYGMVVGEWARLRGLRPGAASPPAGALAGRRAPRASALGQAPPDPRHSRFGEGRPAGNEDPAAVDADMAAYYQARAPEYDDWYERRGRHADPDTDAAWFLELATVGTRVGRFAAGPPAGSAALDVGCGTGRWTAVLAERRTITVVGVDRAPAMLEQTQARLRRSGLWALLVRGDALELPFPEATFDAAVSGFVFDHLALAQRPAFFTELRRVVRPGGRVLLLDSRREARHTAEVEIQTRPLRDGRTFRVRKSLFTAATLRAALAPLGPAEAGETPNFFVWAEVTL